MWLWENFQLYPWLSFYFNWTALVHSLTLRLWPLPSLLASGWVLYKTTSEMNKLLAWMTWWRRWKGAKEEKWRCHRRWSAVKSQSSKTCWLCLQHTQLCGTVHCIECPSFLDTVLAKAFEGQLPETNWHLPCHILDNRRKTPLLKIYLGASQQNTGLPIKDYPAISFALGYISSFIPKSDKIPVLDVLWVPSPPFCIP